MSEELEQVVEEPTGEDPVGDVVEAIEEIAGEVIPGPVVPLFEIALKQIGDKHHAHEATTGIEALSESLGNAVGETVLGISELLGHEAFHIKLRK